MDIEYEVKHQTLGTLFIIFACFQVVVLIAGFMALTMAMAGTFAAPSVNDPALKWYTVMAVCGVVAMPLSIIVFVVALVAGIGIKKRKRYGRIWGMIAAIVSLLEFPFGTVLGIFALRVLTDDRGKQIYSERSSTV